jgi:hypothetical protein
MLDKRKLILDTFCEVYDQLLPWEDESFYDFSNHTIVPGAIYIIGRTQFNLNKERIRELVESDTIRVVLSNPAEGSETLKAHCESVHNIADLVVQGRILLIGGGDMEPDWPCLVYDSFLPKIHDYKQNLIEINRSEALYSTPNKPFKFLFLNGRLRGHRKFLIEKLDLMGLLDQSLWTSLESRKSMYSNLSVPFNGQDQMFTLREPHLLPSKYEVDRYCNNIDLVPKLGFIKHNLFDQEWGEIYLKAEPYIDTYFSLVSETVCDYPYSFRTEKIWKPVAIGHPWIAAANRGYYRDMRNLGFQTFSHVIDESFDEIDNTQDRLTRITQIVEDLCKQDLDEFLKSCYNVCKYNQQHLLEMRQTVRKEFPRRFLQFIKQSHFDE